MHQAIQLCNFLFNWLKLFQGKLTFTKNSKNSFQPISSFWILMWVFILTSCLWGIFQWISLEREREKGAVASWLVRSSPDRLVRARALAWDIVLCSWARHITLTVPLSTQVYKWVQLNLNYPDLDYPDYLIIQTFFSGPNFFMNINQLWLSQTAQ